MLVECDISPLDLIIKCLSYVELSLNTYFIHAEKVNKNKNKTWNIK